jgi:hypothetical protein
MRSFPERVVYALKNVQERWGFILYKRRGAEKLCKVEIRGRRVDARQSDNQEP